MISYMTISEKHTEFLAMTGSSIEEFKALLPDFKKAAGESKVTIEEKRERKTVIYKNSPLSTVADYFDIHEAVHEPDCARHSFWNQSAEGEHVHTLLYADIVRSFEQVWIFPAQGYERY